MPVKSTISSAAPRQPAAAVQQERKPLTDAQIRDAADDFKSSYTHGGQRFDAFDWVGFARAIEAAHGITS